MPVVERAPWEPKPAVEPGPRMQNVRVSDTEFGTLLTGDGATFNFGEEYQKGEKMFRRTFEAVYIKFAASSGETKISRYDSGGSRQHVWATPDGKINYTRIDLGDLELKDGELDDYFFSVDDEWISEILVLGWGDIPKTVVPMLPRNSIVDEFDAKVAQAA